MNDPAIVAHELETASNEQILKELLNRTVGDKLGASRKGMLAVPIDVKQDDTSITVFADLPGVDEDEIHLELEGNTLHIAAEREFDHDNEDSEDYLILEREFGPLDRSVDLPGKLDAHGMTAKYKRGVLKVRVPKIRKE